MNAFLDGIEHSILHYWYLYIAGIILIVAWQLRLVDDVVQGALPILGTTVLGIIAWKLWVHYVRQNFISGIQWVVLEIVPPRDVLRSPKAMELFLTNALYHWSIKGEKEEYWQGAVWFWFSLEIASIDGQVHFFLRTPSRLKELIETQMYAQYPQAQVKVVEDYTLAVPEISPQSEWDGWGCEFTLNKPVAFPILTYVDFGLDKDPKEEFKIDPISPVVELFGSIQKGEQMWMQIVITPSKKTYHAHTGHGPNNWQQEAERELVELLEPYTAARMREDKPGVFAKEIRAPRHMEDIVEGASRKMQKLGFDTGIRVMYVAKKNVYNANNRRSIRTIFRQYESPFLNGFSRVNSTGVEAYAGIFDASQKTLMRITDRMLNEYRERSFFHLPLRHHLFNEHTMPWPVSPFLFPAYKHPHTFVLNTEEIATLWHFPGQILKVPSLERIESKEASPPTNLPT